MLFPPTINPTLFFSARAWLAGSGRKFSLQPTNKSFLNSIFSEGFAPRPPFPLGGMCTTNKLRYVLRRKNRSADMSKLHFQLNTTSRPSKNYRNRDYSFILGLLAHFRFSRILGFRFRPLPFDTECKSDPLL